MTSSQTPRKISTELAKLCLCLSLCQGCGPSDHRLSEEEWSQMVDMPAQTTEAASELVQRDAESRQEWLELHDDLQQERTEIGRQRDLLETDRREWHASDKRSGILAAALLSIGGLIACILPLVLMAVLLWPRKQEEASQEVCDLLVEKITSEPTLDFPRDDPTKRLSDDSL